MAVSVSQNLDHGTAAKAVGNNHPVVHILMVICVHDDHHTQYKSVVIARVDVDLVAHLVQQYCPC